MDDVCARAQAAAVAIGPLLLTRGWKLATAESCTGGLIGHVLTNVSGSSNYYWGGVIAYDNSVKMGLLSVCAEDLRTVGAVSPEVALQMARGVRAATGAQVGVSTTGIAGPSGGTPSKPVGTVYVGVSTPCGDRVEHYCWLSDREGNKWLSTAAALEMTLALLTEQAGS